MKLLPPFVLSAGLGLGLSLTFVTGLGFRAADALATEPILASEAPTAQTLLHQTVTGNSTQPYRATAILKVWRLGGEKPLVTRASLAVDLAGSYKLQLLEPATQAAIAYRQHAATGQLDIAPLQSSYQGFVTHFFENFLLMPLAGKEALIHLNYELRLIGRDVVMGRDCQVLELIPKHHSSDKRTQETLIPVPRRRLWIDNASRIPLKAAFYWDWPRWKQSTQVNQTPYAELSLQDFTLGTGPEKVTKVPASYLLTDLSTSQTVYQSLEAATSGEQQRFAAPDYLPKGFVLQDVGQWRFRGQEIQVLTFSDGLAQLCVLRMTQAAKADLTTAANRPWLDIIKDLAFLAPNNYFQLDQEDAFVFVFGEVHPLELERIAENLWLPEDAE